MLAIKLAFLCCCFSLLICCSDMLFKSMIDLIKNLVRYSPKYARIDVKAAATQQPERCNNNMKGLPKSPNANNENAPPQKFKQNVVLFYLLDISTCLKLSQDWMLRTITSVLSSMYMTLTYFITYFIYIFTYLLLGILLKKLNFFIFYDIFYGLLSPRTWYLHTCLKIRAKLKDKRILVISSFYLISFYVWSL